PHNSKINERSVIVKQMFLFFLLVCDLTSSRLGLHGGDRYGIDNVFRLASSGEVVTRLIQTLKDRPDGGTARKAFGEFIGNIAGVKIGENKHVGAAGHRRARSLRFAYRVYKRRISLKLPVY